MILILIYLDEDAGYCIYLVVTDLFFGAGLPVMVYLTLKRDSNYWQGTIISSFADSGTLKKAPSEADIRTPLLGTSFDTETAATLAEGMDDVTCERISWAHIELERRSHSQHKSTLGRCLTAPPPSISSNLF
jgi:hypothetical protein